MSKFDELCLAFKEGRDAAIKDRDAAWDFQARFVNGFKRYLDYSDPFTFQPVISQPKPNSQYSPPGTLEIGEDGFWHFGFVITVYAAKNEFPQFRGLIHLSFRCSADSVVVRPSPNADPITV
jgi:hypothetical protein